MNEKKKKPNQPKVTSADLAGLSAGYCKFEERIELGICSHCC